MKSDVQLQSAKNERDELRLLKLLNKHTSLKFHVMNDAVNLFADSNRKFSFKLETIESLRKKDCVASNENQIVLTGLGRKHLKRHLFPDAPYSAQHMQPTDKAINENGIRSVVTCNLAESPLSRLFNRKNKSGSRWLSQEEYQAGEKFRVEFERSNLQPRISANWEASISTKTRTNAASDLSDFSIDSRKRLNTAIKTLGPELSDIVIDVCCYLKGLEEIEREKAWPPRSAKLLLKAALANLARHYGLNQKNTRQKVSSWNGENYRPTL